MSDLVECFGIVFGLAALALMASESLKAVSRWHKHQMFLASARAAEMSPDEYKEKTTTEHWKDLLTPGLLTKMEMLDRKPYLYSHNRLFACPQCGGTDSLLEYTQNDCNFLLTCDRCGHKWSVLREVVK